MVTVYIALGSNLDDPCAQLKQAIFSLEMFPATSVEKISSFYRSAPVGVPDQPDYINAVVKINTKLTAHILLDYLQSTEKHQGRLRMQKWGARTLDMDILLYGDQIFNDERLTIPHAEMHKRCFVLQPLHEIAPDAEVYGIGTVAGLLKQMDTSRLEKIT